MVNVDIDALSRAIEYLKLVNSVELNAIQWTRNGHPFNVSIPSDWKYTGLSNVDAAKHYVLNKDF